MSVVGEIKQHIEDIEAAQYISGTLRDISAVELGGLMQRFGTNDMFYTELTELYQTVWNIARERGHGKDNREQRSVYVAYTTNRHFYGALNRNVIHLFKEKTGSKDECMIIGDTGRQAWMARTKKRKAIDYLSFEGDMPTTKEKERFLERVAGYDRVFVFYPRFVTVFSQQPAMVDISFQPPEKTNKRDSSMERQFLLEPDIDEMLTFFQTQVRNALFERVLLETQLSRVAARLVKMDTADQNAEHLLVQERHALRHAHTTTASRQMLETLVGYIQWHKKNA